MKIEVIKFDISNELDIVLANKRTSQLCDLTGLSFFSKTAFITAVSEITRNVIEHAGTGKITYYAYPDGTQLEAVISDQGPGIKNFEKVLQKPYLPGIKGCGLQNSKKLVDFFNIDTSELGTTVSLGMKTNKKGIPVNANIVGEWSEFFKHEKAVSPYEEIKRQNQQLLEITDQLRIKNLETDEQLLQIKDLNNQLNKNNKELEDFASTLSHDLRSPISNLKMLVSIIENSKSAEKKAEYIKDFKTQVERLDEMILGLAEVIDLKNTAKSIANSVLFEDILNVVLSELNNEIKTSHVLIDFDFHKRSTIKYYEVYIHSILMNLISNAIKYRSQERDPVISISTTTEGDKVVLIVQDNGSGMDLARMGNDLFKPFRRFNTKTSGIGIGLHLIKGMVEKNGGYIGVTSQPDRGTTFRVFMKEYDA
jgi:signal transduction histidine kinase